MGLPWDSWLSYFFLSAEFGFDCTKTADASYIAFWVKFLTEHNNAIMSAASMASKAVEFLHKQEETQEQEKELENVRNAYHLFVGGVIGASIGTLLGLLARIVQYF